MINITCSGLIQAAVVAIAKVWQCHVERAAASATTSAAEPSESEADAYLRARPEDMYRVFQTPKDKLLLKKQQSVILPRTTHHEVLDQSKRTNWASLHEVFSTVPVIVNMHMGKKCSLRRGWWCLWQSVIAYRPWLGYRWQGISHVTLRGTIIRRGSVSYMPHSNPLPMCMGISETSSSKAPERQRQRMKLNGPPAAKSRNYRATCPQRNWFKHL